MTAGLGIRKPARIEPEHALGWHGTGVGHLNAANSLRNARQDHERSVALLLGFAIEACGKSILIARSRPDPVEGRRTLGYGSDAKELDALLRSIGHDPIALLDSLDRFTDLGAWSAVDRAQTKYWRQQLHAAHAPLRRFLGRDEDAPEFGLLGSASVDALMFEARPVLEHMRQLTSAGIFAARYFPGPQVYRLPIPRNLERFQISDTPYYTASPFVIAAAIAGISAAEHGLDA